MSAFREWLRESELNESKLDKSSIMSGGTPSRDISLDTKKGEIGIWLNGGSKYSLKLESYIVSNMREKFYGDESDKYMEKYLDKLAIDVAEFITKEVTKWEKDFKAK